MKTKVIPCLLLCWLVLIVTIASAQATIDPQAKLKAEIEEKAKAERAIELERRAAATAAAEHSRAANLVLKVQRKAAARAAAETTRAAMKAYHQQQRAAARSLAEANRMQLRMKQIEQRSRPDGFKFLWSRPAIDIKNIVKGAPYSAKAVTEHTQTLSDGNQIIHRNEALYYRDNEGRLRIEQTLKTIGKWAAQDQPAKIITIYDPVAGSYYSLDPNTRMAVQDPSGTLRMKMREMQKIEAQYTEKLKNDMKMKMSDPGKEKEKYVDSPKTNIKPEEQSDSRRKKEMLGKQTIEGVVTEGTRTTRTIPAGEIGNVRPIEIVDERWYSSELQLHVLTKHQDPRSGETVYRLTNINRGEQDRSLFEVPSDYRIVDKFSYRSPKKVEEPKVP